MVNRCQSAFRLWVSSPHSEHRQPGKYDAGESVLGRDGPKGFFWPKPKTEIGKKIVAETENGRNRNTFGGRNQWPKPKHLKKQKQFSVAGLQPAFQLQDCNQYF